MNLQVDTRIVLRADYFEQRANRSRGLSLATDDVTHIVRMNVEREQHAHLVNRPIGFDVFWVRHQGLHKSDNKLLISVLFGHSAFTSPARFRRKCASKFITTSAADLPAKPVNRC